jgi:hypothetical protein
MSIEADFRRAWSEVSPDESSQRDHLALAMGFLMGAAMPGCAASIAAGWLARWPDTPLPDIVAALVAPAEPEGDVG